MKAVRIYLAALVAVATAAPAMSGEARSEVERVPAEIIRETRGAITMGEMHYFEEEYDQAMPHLTVAAERGFKEAQSQLGSIYLNGLGSTEKDIVQAIGWLGVAASGESRPAIVELYESVMSSIPEQHHAALNQVVEQFKSAYDGNRTRVRCTFNRIEGSGRDALHCRFIDAAHYAEFSRD